MKAKLTKQPQLHANIQSRRKSELQDQCDCACDCTYASAERDFSPLPFPVIYSLELTFACNNRCLGCGNNLQGKSLAEKVNPRSIMPIGNWERILEQIVPYAHSLKITGGEPLLYPQFESIVRIVQQKGLRFTLFSNGRWQEPEHVISLLRATPQCVGLLISLHGADAESHEAFSGVEGSFLETVRNIQKATAAGLTVHTNAVLTRYNHQQIEMLVRLSQSLGAECAVFNRYVGQPLPELDVPQSDLKRAIWEIDSLDPEGSRVKFGTCIPLCFAESSSTGCLAGTAYCTIDPLGNVRPCNHAPNIVGNLFADSLETIWHSEGMQSWRDMVPTSCNTCSAFSTCHGGCRADGALRGVNCDPLITRPLQTALLPRPRAEEELLLYEKSVPYLEYSLQKRPDGAILCQGSNSIPLSDCAISVVEAIQRPVTLSQVHAVFGNDAIDFIGELYSRGAVSLNW